MATSRRGFYLVGLAGLVGVDPAGAGLGLFWLALCGAVGGRVAHTGTAAAVLVSCCAKREEILQAQVEGEIRSDIQCHMAARRSTVNKDGTR